MIKYRRTKKLLRNITDAEYNALMLLGIPNGCIRYDLDWLYRNQPRTEHMVFMVKTWGGTIVSWGLLRVNPDAKAPFYQCYTHPNHRRQGLAAKLLGDVVRHVGSDTIMHSPWDPVSESFFKAVGITKPELIIYG